MIADTDVPSVLCYKLRVAQVLVLVTNRGRKGHVERLSLTGEIANWIRDVIDLEAVEPGAKLDERVLASRFTVSKTPVREVLL